MTTIDRFNGVSSGLGRKAPVRVATTANITLAGLQTIGGVALAGNDRVLVRAQTSGVENGIYTASTGNWTRAADFDGANDVVSGTAVLAAAGTAYAGTEFYLSTPGTVTIGTTALTFPARTALPIPAGTVTQSMLAADSVGAAHIQAGAVGASEIADGAVGTAEIADDAVTFAKMQNVATGTFAGRASASAGDIEALTTNQALDLLTGLAGPLSGSRNRLINACFRVNQRAYVTNTALASGSFGHDRWKAGASGCTYTFTQAPATTAITITAGTLTQIVEDKNVEGGTYTLSWVGTAQARFAHSGGALGGSYAASPLTVTGVAAGQTITVEFNTGTLACAQLEPGSADTPFERRHYAAELVLCQRYYETGFGGIWSNLVASASYRAFANFANKKASVPTIVTAMGQVSSFPTTAPTTAEITADGFRAAATSSATVTSPGGYSFTWAASAEL